MACYHPLPAWRTQNGNIVLSKDQADSYQLRLPCGNCLGCRMARARAWALRCQLELQQHERTTFATLTYDEKHVPATLEKRHLQLWLKRLRAAAGPLRFFASGEYGTTTERPHYHAILFGIANKEAGMIQDTWHMGYTSTAEITPQRISYVAGYTSKKIGFKQSMSEDRVDPDTGELYQWQPPFIQMSRRPGIGGHARQWATSWRLYAIHNGIRMPVPRFLHEAWKATATDQQLEELLFEKSRLALKRDSTIQTLQAQEKIAIKKQQLQSETRHF